MKISAIICEFNPIHTGHKRLIDYAKTISDKVVCIMSGNFVQRGMPACANKYDRARHAILCGADLVVELPTIFATASAENFAFGGVQIANQLQADYLVFGSECGDINALWQCAQALCNAEINEKIKQYLTTGASYPKAVSLALGNDILHSPNNVLAVEYLRALTKTNSKITPFTIQRADNFNSCSAQEFASSSALRKEISLRNDYTFDFVTSDIDDTIEQRFLQFVPHHLSMLTTEDLQNIEGISEGIENKIVSADKHLGYEKLMEDIKSKRYTRAKLQRILLNCILRITTADVINAKSCAIATKVLAVKSTATQLLSLTNDLVDDVTKRADNLYLSFDGKTAPTKLQKLY